MAKRAFAAKWAAMKRRKHDSYNVEGACVVK